MHKLSHGMIDRPQSNMLISCNMLQITANEQKKKRAMNGNKEVCTKHTRIQDLEKRKKETGRHYSHLWNVCMCWKFVQKKGKIELVTNHKRGCVLAQTKKCENAFFHNSKCKKKKEEEEKEEHNSELFRRPLCTTVGHDPGRVVAGIFQAPHKLTPRRPPLHWCTVFASVVHL